MPSTAAAFTKKQQKRAKQREERDARNLEIAQRQEAKDEECAPRAQRKAVSDADGRMLRGPRVRRSGSGFLLGSQIQTLYNLGKKNGDRALIKARHVRAAEQFMAEWEAFSGAANVGKSDFLAMIMSRHGSSTPSGSHDHRILAQLAGKSAFIETCEAMGNALSVLIHTCLLNIEFKQWYEDQKMEFRNAKGFLSASLDRLADHYGLK